MIGANSKPDIEDSLKNLTPEQAIQNANAEAKQRALERQIRYNKEQLHVAKKLDDKELVQRFKLRGKTLEMARKDWMEKHPFLVRDRSRESYKTNNKEHELKIEDKVKRELEARPYKSVKDEWLKNADKSKAKVSEKTYWEYDGKRYEVDGKHVVHDYSNKEKEVADWIASRFGKHVELVPRVNFPKGINTPDYLIDEEKFDLKVITGKGKNVLDGNLRKTKKQADNIIFDVSESKLTELEIRKQINRIYKDKRRQVNVIVIKKEDKVLMVAKKRS